MLVFGWSIAALGAMGLATSVVLELIKREPIYMTIAKISAGIFGLGGVILAISVLGG